MTAEEYVRRIGIHPVDVDQDRGVVTFKIEMKITMLERLLGTWVPCDYFMLTHPREGVLSFVLGQEPGAEMRSDPGEGVRRLVEP